MPVLDFDEKYLVTQKNTRVKYVRISGIVSSATIERFEKFISNLRNHSEPVVIGFSEVEYLNSSALSLLADFIMGMREKGNKVVFFGFHNDALRLVQMIGLDKIFNLIATCEQALEYIDGEKVDLASYEEKEVACVENLFHGVVLLAIRDQEKTGRFIARLFESENSRVIFADSLVCVREALSFNRVNIVILDGDLPDYHEICKEIKLNPQSSVTSLICLGDFIEKSDDGYIVLPDEQVSEPFELHELSAVVRSELKRSGLGKKVYDREIKIELRCDEYACENGGRISERLAKLCNFPHHLRDSFFFAVREAIDNACVHGNHLQPDTVVEVLIVSYVNGIEITIVDEGEGFNCEKWLQLAQQHDPVSHAKIRSEEGLRGGLGISLMSRFCDKLEYFKPGNIVKLTKFFDAEE